MARYSKGNRVRIDIPDERDPDHDQYHGEHGIIVDILEANPTVESARDDPVYRVNVDDGDTAYFRRRDIRPPLE